MLAAFPSTGGGGSFDGTRLTHGAVLEVTPEQAARLKEWHNVAIFEPRGVVGQVAYDLELDAYVLEGVLRANLPDSEPPGAEGAGEFSSIPGVHLLELVQVTRRKEVPMLRPEDIMRPSWETTPEPEPVQAGELQVEDRAMPTADEDDPEAQFLYRCKLCPRRFPSHPALERHHEFEHEVFV